MPETREWPTPLRRLAKTSLAIIYTGSAVAGWHVVLGAEHAAAPWWAVGLGLLAGGGGVLALAAMLWELWMAERPAAWLVAFALSVYALVDSARLLAASVASVRLAWPAAVAMVGQVPDGWSRVAAHIGSAWHLLAAMLDPPTGPDVSGTALLWVSAAAVGLRITHLWAFDLNLNIAKRRAEDARRRYAQDARGLA